MSCKGGGGSGEGGSIYGSVGMHIFAHHTLVSGLFHKHALPFKGTGSKDLRKGLGLQDRMIQVFKYSEALLFLF